MTGLKLRDARSADRQAVFEFCKSTWPEYGDYIPRVWRGWLRDGRGRFIVAEWDGRPIGLAKVTEFSKGEIWLEGLRVDPGYRGKGIARSLNLEVLRTVRRMQPRAVRFCTGRENRATRHMAEKMGFEIVSRLRYYWQKSRRARVRGEFARKSDTDTVHGFILDSRFLRLTSGLIAEGWVFREYSRVVLNRYIREKRVILLRRSTKLSGVAVYPFEENDGSLTLGFVDGDEVSIGILAKNCMYLAAARRLGYCSVAVPTRGFARMVESKGYKRADSVGQIVYELGREKLESLTLR